MDAQTPAPASPSVLVVCSDPARLTWFAAVLRREGHGVLTARSGREGLRHAYARRPALVVLDATVAAPGTQETLELLRGTSSVPVLMVLPRADADDGQALLGGADDVLTGKTDATRLIARVRSLLPRRMSA